jgi:hypothetical protein
MSNWMRMTRDALRPILSSRMEYRFRRALLTPVPVAHRSPYSHVVHAALWKTGSQWIRLILSDPRIYRGCGLKPYVWDNVREHADLARQFRDAPRAILLASVDTAEATAQLVGNNDFKAFFVVRDPRALLVSWYFSTRYTHIPTAGVMAHRAQLEGTDDVEGMALMFEAFCAEFLPVMESWIARGRLDASQQILKFEQLTRQGPAEWVTQLASLGIKVSESTMADVLKMYSVQNLSKPTDDEKGDKYAAANKRNWRDHLAAGELSGVRDKLTGIAADLGYAE